jgi:hypothetical protein
MKLVDSLGETVGYKTDQRDVAIEPQGSHRQT